MYVDICLWLWGNVKYNAMTVKRSKGALYFGEECGSMGKLWMAFLLILVLEDGKKTFFCEDRTFSISYQFCFSYSIQFFFMSGTSG